MVRTSLLELPGIVSPMVQSAYGCKSRGPEVGSVGRKERRAGQAMQAAGEGSDQLEGVLGPVDLQRRLCRSGRQAARPGELLLLGSPPSPRPVFSRRATTNGKELVAMAYQLPPAQAQAQAQAEPTLTVAVSLVIAYLAYRAVYSLVPALAHDLVAKGLKGRDMLKPGFKRDEALSPDHDGDEEAAPGRKYLCVLNPRKPCIQSHQLNTATATARKRPASSAPRSTSSSSRSLPPCRTSRPSSRLPSYLRPARSPSRA